jgi:tRNA(Ile)-lysidine synthase
VIPVTWNKISISFCKNRMVRKVITLEQRIADFIRKHHLVSQGETLVIGVSGGADSVCLLHVLSKLKTIFDLQLYAAHLNHKLRGEESDEDAWYVVALAESLGIPLILDTRDVASFQEKQRCSLEEAAREIRYQFLSGAAGEAGASRVAVGHTRDDQVETVLMHILRGTGITGLRGLQPETALSTGEEGVRLIVVRPLLEVSRLETVAYCNKFRLKPRFDSSNQSCAFFRNRVRLELLPLLRKYNTQVDTALLRLAAIATDETCYLEEQISGLWPEIVCVEPNALYLDKEKMCGLTSTLQRYLFRKAIEQLLGNIKDIEADHIEAMLHFLTKPAGKILQLPREVRLAVEYGRVVLSLAETSLSPFPVLNKEVVLNLPGETMVPGWRIITEILDKNEATCGFTNQNNFTALFDPQKTGSDLLVRSRKRGDRFQPLGMSQQKKLQDFMVDARIPQSWRGSVPLLCSPDKILWVVGWRIDERVKVSGDTEKICRVTFERVPNGCR